MGILIADKFKQWEQEADKRFQTLKRNEEELNRIFIDIYGLQDELTPEVEYKDVTVRKAELGREIRSLISYAVGGTTWMYRGLHLRAALLMPQNTAPLLLLKTTSSPSARRIILKTTLCCFLWILSARFTAKTPLAITWTS